MSTHSYDREEFLGEFFPDAGEQAEIAAGVERLSRVSAIDHAQEGATELRTLAAYVEALGGRLEIVADFGDERLAFTEPAA